jgi:hypothetical protein
MNSELSVNFIKKLESLQNIIIESDNEQTCGDGKNLVNNEEFPITNNFTDGLYMRQMKMMAGSIVVSAIHHTNHFWFLLSGKVIVEDENETIEHIAPCWSMKEIEDNFFSITLEEYNKKEKTWQE